jgi:hypothetical protein
MTPALGKRLNWWWCQDEICDCTQPVIEEVMPSDGAWPGPRAKVVDVERGPMIGPTHSSDTEEREEQRQWAIDACARHGIPYHEPGAQ